MQNYPPQHSVPSVCLHSLLLWFFPLYFLWHLSKKRVIMQIFFSLRDWRFFLVKKTTTAAAEKSWKFFLFRFQLRVAKVGFMMAELPLIVTSVDRKGDFLANDERAERKATKRPPVLKLKWAIYGDDFCLNILYLLACSVPPVYKVTQSCNLDQL